MRILTTIAVVMTLVLATAGCSPQSPPNTTPAVEPTPPSVTEPQPADHSAPEPAADDAANATAREVDRPFVQDDHGNRIPVTVGAAPGYVPDSACRDCHDALYDDYQQVGMARSVYEPTLADTTEDYENNQFYHELSDRHYEMSHRDGVFYQKRYQLGPDGARINELEAKVDLVIGSGRNVRTYATRNAAGELYQLPVSWYPQTRSWGMSPGYDVRDHAGFTRQIERECLFCHNAYPEQPAGTDVLGQPFAYPPHLPQGIGCQRCHGPGAEHLRVAYTRPADPQETRASIVNPARLEPKLRDDVCNQCHLQPTSNPKSIIRMVGRGDYSYVPGEPIEDYMLIVDYATPGGKSGRFEANHHAYRLYQSPCYLNAAEALSCLTCHDPHRKPSEKDKVAYYRQKCLTCHGIDECGVAATAEPAPTDHAGAADCIACHMPKHRPEDMIHVLVTDHLIRRDPAPEEWIAPRRERGRAVAPMPNAESPDRVPGEAALALHLALFASVHTIAPQLDALRSAISNAGPDGADAYLYQARLEEAAGLYADAEQTYRKAVEHSPNVLGGYIGLATVLQRQGHFEQALEPARRAVEMNPGAADAYHVLGTALLALNRVNDAGPTLQRALYLRPYHVPARANLAKAFASIGNFGSAVAEYKTLLAVDPADTGTYVDLAELLFYLKRTDEAVERLQYGLSQRPNAPELYETLAMVFVLTDRLDEALEASAKARKRGGNGALCGMVDGLVYRRKGDVVKSLSAFNASRKKETPSGRHSVLYRMVQEQASKTPGS